MDATYSIIIDIDVSISEDDYNNNIFYDIKLINNNEIKPDIYIIYDESEDIFSVIHNIPNYNLRIFIDDYKLIKTCLNILMRNIKIINIVFNINDDIHYSLEHINIINNCFNDDIYNLITGICIYNNGKLYIELFDFIFNKFTNITKIYQNDNYKIKEEDKEKLISYLINNHNIVEVVDTKNNKIKSLCDYNKSIKNTLLGLCIEQYKQKDDLSLNIKSIIKEENICIKHRKNKEKLLTC